MIDELKLHRIRKASRQLVRELGFLNQTIAGTNYSGSAVHAIIEIGMRSRLTAKKLSEILKLEKSTVSRLVKGLVKSGELLEEKSENDGREKILKLTAKGEQTLREIHKFGNTQVSGALASLNDNSKDVILDGLEAYASALAADTPNDHKDFDIKTGYRAGLIAGVTELHADYYSRVHSLNEVFEAEVATNLSEFMMRIDRDINEIWYVEHNGRIVASIAIDGEEIGNGNALLRWFIVDERYQSFGLGSRLMNEAMQFCEQNGFNEIHLWTFKGLDAARKLYERNGFALVKEVESDDWRDGVTMQMFVR